MNNTGKNFNKHEEEVVIVECDINKGRYESIVEVTYNDGKREELFRYYWDELSFSAEEFIGLTIKEALELRSQRDITYLRS